MIPIIYADLIDDVGNLARFEEIYEEYYQQMFHRANSILHDAYEAEDAVHDAFIGIARNMKTVSTISDQADLFYYLMRSAENAAYNRTRQTRHYANALPLEEGLVGSKHSFWESLCTKLDYEQLLRAIGSLPPMYREVLYYHFVLGLTIPEVAKGLDIKLSTAKQRLVRGKQALLDAIEKEGGLNYGTK